MLDRAKKTMIVWAIVFVFGAIEFSCADKEGQGTLKFELWGEAFIEDGIPEAELVDGFSITFDKFLINLGQISVAQQGDEPAFEDAAMKIWDLTQEGPFPIAEVTVPVGEYDDTSYTIAKATSSSTSGNAAIADLQMMTNNGYSIYVSGTATDGMRTKTFKWGFNTETHYGPCYCEAVLVDGGEASIQITIHGDHLFYDDATAENPSLRFNDIALADDNDDDEIMAAELSAYSITTLPNYGVGNLDIDNLWDFISHMTSTLGHIDGEGHCH